MIEHIHLLLLFTKIAALFYLLLMLLYMAGWQRLLRIVRQRPADIKLLSIIIAMRNEAANIPKLLQALSSQTYPAEKLQILLVNDHSTDQSVSLARKQAQALGMSNLQIIENEGNGKKLAIQTAIKHAEGEWLLYTDADCIPHKAWAETMFAAAQQAKEVMLLGPVKLWPVRGTMQIFQALEMNSLIAATAGSAGSGFASMANGANMMLHRSVLAGDDGSLVKPRFASGDDMFRLQSVISEYGSKAIGMVIHPEAMVTTTPAPDLKSFMLQRFRWVSKSSGYRRPEIILPAMVVFAFTSLLVILLFLSLFFPVLLLAYVTFVLLKTLTDLLLVWPAHRIANQTGLLRWFPLFQLFYPPYVLFTALVGLAMPVSWKGRKQKGLGMY